MLSRRLFIGASLSLLAVFPRQASSELQCGPYGPNGVQVCSAGLPYPTADTIFAAQESSQWCWAASIQMIFKHYGYTVSQESIVSRAFGSSVNMPASPGVLLSAINQEWTDTSGRRFRVSGSSYGISPQQAAQDLAAGRPLIVGTMGHAMVLTAVTYLRDVAGNGAIVDAVVRDPWPGRGRRSLTPEEWLSMSFVALVRVTALGSGDEDDEGETEEPDCETVKTECEHAAHPSGDIQPCQHAAHPGGDIGSCNHGCYTPYGYGPCHPNGDIYPCVHPAHPSGDISECYHRKHPYDTREVCP